MPRRFLAHRLVALAAALVPATCLLPTAAAQTPTTASPSDIVLLSSGATRVAGRWTREVDATAAGGSRLRHPDAGAPKLSNALASPVDFFEMTFTAEAGRTYRLWVRGRADRDSWANDSVYVQFSGSVTSTGAATYRIGTTSGAAVNLEDCSGCGVSGWKWQDNGYGGVGLLGPVVYFEASGTQLMRVQTREDGIAIDEVMLSPQTYATTSPTGVLLPASSSTGSEPASALPAPDANGNIVIGAANATSRAGAWVVESDAAAWGGSKLRHPDAGAGKLTSALASPVNYVDIAFQATANTPYHLWFHGRADRDAWSNDSVFVQFSASVTTSGGAVYRIGTTSATEVNLEECSGCGLSGWMWQDNGYGSGVLGSPISFAESGTQIMRVQTREDGLSIDQIVLSPVTYASAAPVGLVSPATSGSSGDPAPAPASTTLKFLHWNIHHGVGTDGVYDLDRIATQIALAAPQVVSLNEVERFSSSWGYEDQPARFAQLLTSKTGRQWHYHFAQRYGNTNGQGNLLLSVYPLDAASSQLLAGGRSAAQATITVNGRQVNVFSTHLDDASASTRTSEISQLLPWASGFGEARIIAGDFNASPGASELVPVGNAYYDVWAKAVAERTAVAYADNPTGNTRNGRIDYLWLSRGATTAVLKGAQVIDVRDANGVQPSDHRPLVGTFEIR